LEIHIHRGIFFILYPIFADPKKKGPKQITQKQTTTMQNTHPLTLLLLGVITLLTLCTPTLAGPDWWQMYNNEIACAHKDVRALGAINSFCNTNVYTGGEYAAEGVALAGARVGISASCGWGTYVPQVWCQSQFYEVCAWGNNKGRGQRNYDGGCQHFWITNG
jgi:hypothetical protein